MAIAFKETIKLPGFRSFRQLGTLTFTGSYVVGGEIPSGLIKVWTAKNALGARFFNKGPNVFTYDPVTGKVLVYAAGVELTAAAYPASVTNDTVTMDIEFLKLG